MWLCNVVPLWPSLSPTLLLLLWIWSLMHLSCLLVCLHMIRHVLVLVAYVLSLNYIGTVNAVAPPLVYQHYLRMVLASLRLGSSVSHPVLLAKYVCTNHPRVLVCQVVVRIGMSYLNYR